MAKTFAARVSKKERTTIDLSERLGRDVFKISDEKLLQGARLDKIKLKDIPISIKNNFDLLNKNVYTIIWTTTPWTLPSNLAIAINKDIEYMVLEKDCNLYIFAKSLEEKVKKIL